MAIVLIFEQREHGVSVWIGPCHHEVPIFLIADERTPEQRAENVLPPSRVAHKGIARKGFLPGKAFSPALWGAVGLCETQRIEHRNGRIFGQIQVPATARGEHSLPSPYERDQVFDPQIQCALPVGTGAHGHLLLFYMCKIFGNATHVKNRKVRAYPHRNPRRRLGADRRARRLRLAGRGRGSSRYHAAVGLCAFRHAGRAFSSLSSAAPTSAPTSGRSSMPHSPLPTRGSAFAPALRYGSTCSMPHIYPVASDLIPPARHGRRSGRGCGTTRMNDLRQAFRQLIRGLDKAGELAGQ